MRDLIPTYVWTPPTYTIMIELAQVHLSKVAICFHNKEHNNIWMESEGEEMKRWRNLYTREGCVKVEWERDGGRDDDDDDDCLWNGLIKKNLQLEWSVMLCCLFTYLFIG